MALNASFKDLVEDYRRDPQRQAEVEQRLRISDTSLEFSNGNFQNIARKGQLVEVENEPFIKVSDYDGYSASTPQTLKSSKQVFAIDEAAKWDVRIYDVDDIQSADDLHSLVVDNAAYQAARYMTKKRFSAIKDANPIQLAEVDLSNGGAPAAFNSTDGDAIFTTLMNGQDALRSQGINPNDLKAALPSKAVGNLVFSSYINNSTEGANETNALGEVGGLAQARLFSSIDTPKTEADYNATTSAAVAVGAEVITVDTVRDGAGTPAAVTPMVGDKFTSNSEVYTVLTVSETSTSGEFRLTLDRPVETAITDNHVLTVTGYTHEHIIYAAGRPLSTVVQRNFRLGVNEMEDDYFAARLKGLTLFDNFMTIKGRQHCAIAPVKVRSFTSV